MKLEKIFFLIMIIALVLALIIINYPLDKKKEIVEISQVCFKKNCFTVESAATAIQRSLGLMNRENLPLDQAMLFIFSAEARHGFWMKNTLIPLDIIWLDKNQKVVFINKNTPPCGQEPCEIIKPDRDALYVLEINAGLADKTKLETGDKMTFK